MQIKSFAVLAAAAAPLASAQLHKLAVDAGLVYFGAATDAPGQRERAGLEAAYEKYDAILDDIDEFGQTTPTNGMKWLFTEPQQGVFNWTEGELITSIAKENGQLLRCHTLVWHSQLAPWVEATNWTAPALKAALELHVRTVAGHWKGRCYAWDVVNEALNEDGTYRESIFYRTFGADYIKWAFQWAAEADPDAKLYYNDYNLESVGGKSEGARRIVRLVQDAGLKIDGVGVQAHFTAERAPTLDQQIAVLRSYAELGVEVAYTELDVRITLPLTETNLAQQAGVYANSTAACVAVKACVGITLWDFYDPFSWVPYVFPGQSNAALWFEDFSKHPAYDAIVKVLKGGAGGCKRRRSLAERRAVLLD